MKQFIKKFLSRKRNVALLAFFALIIIGLGAYTLLGIQKSLERMSSLDETEPYYPDYPPANTSGKDPSYIKRGEYLAKAGDCIACHTNAPEKGPAFAGGLPMQTPFGTIYAPNITPDKETGIGNWTEEQFIKAMREGISPQGHYYYPAFPYLYFNNVAIDDLKAIKAYLDSIPAVRKRNRENEMVWPFNQRLLQWPWRLLFFNPKSEDVEKLGSASDTQGNNVIKRGEYLVEGLGHCAMCHSPSHHIFSDKLSLGAPIREYSLTGSKVSGYLAPDITKKNLANVSIEEIIDVFTKDRLIGGGEIEGPMLEVNHDSLRYLNRSDLEAIALYLKSVQSKAPPKPKGGPGKGVYELYCAGCHEAGAGGAPKYNDPNSWTSLLEKGMPAMYANAIHGMGGMPAKGTCLSCSDDEIKQAVDYMVAAVIGKKAAKTGPKPKKLSLEDGRRLYDKNCSVCHNVGFQNAPKPGDIEAWQPRVKEGFINTYLNVMTGRKGHPPQGACPKCSDDEVLAAVKYMMQISAPGQDYSLW